MTSLSLRIQLITALLGVLLDEGGNWLNFERKSKSAGIRYQRFSPNISCRSETQVRAQTTPRWRALHSSEGCGDRTLDDFDVKKR